MTKQKLNWRQTVELVAPSTPLNQKDLSSLILYARKSNVGKEITYQLTEYEPEDLKKLSVLINWWSFLNRTTALEWRDHATSNKIQKIISKSVSLNKQITFYAVYCPSYKKGVGAFGYTGKTGDYTRETIKKMCEFILKSKGIGLYLNAIAYFSDLLLENIEKLAGTSYKDDLEKNYKDFTNIVTDCSKGLVQTKKLSEIEEFKLNLGEMGMIGENNVLPENIYQRIIDRNVVFYKNNLGWNNEMIEKRTNVLAGSYTYMGNIFRKMYPLGIMYWTESAYERGVMYSGNEQLDPIPIIYPKK